MIKFAQHKYLSMFLGGIFCLFNIGIPIVGTSCPMMKNGHQNASCCSAIRYNQIASIRFESSNRCCEQKFSFPRNTHEFLQTTPLTGCIEKHLQSIPLSFDAKSIHLIDQGYLLFAIPPPWFQQRTHSSCEIPVLLSSLLI